MKKATRQPRDPRGIKPARARKPRTAAKGPSCRSCGAAIAWCVTESGKRIPIDADPSPEGNLVVVAQWDAPGLAIPYDPAKHDGGWARFRAHFATCPNAAPSRTRPGGVS